ncbi:hypothetical protein TI39_contig337g00009 [Zymoseptoria brevis]|uniref:chitinase n=1 Tax=Zymoseptoria brevis TaxID=1047168 RepID=A0A0F4GSN4_9PEZI|nr:hypothetical protein TI39_contig337g00009 [Zymoseptoria brevis]
MDENSVELYSRFTSLKGKFPDLKTWISIGGWTFNDPGITRDVFSTISSSSANRRRFAKEVVKFMRNYGFDGLDLDREYPQADDRGGQPEDYKNFVSLVEHLRREMNLYKMGFSLTISTSYWYLRHFDVKALQSHVDWFNLMSYDLHGTWDKDKVLATHTNLTEIQLALDLLARAGVQSNKVVLDQAWYGRSFRLKDPSCSTPNGNCLFEGDADPGPCSNASVILNYQEIQDIISDKDLIPVQDTRAGVKWISWNDDQWISYDDDDTVARKKDLAQSNCMGGLMVWAMDQKKQSGINMTARNPEGLEDISPVQMSNAEQAAVDKAAKAGCITTECDVECYPRTNEKARILGQPGQISTNDKCKKNKYRKLCCFDGTIMRDCEWHGFPGTGKSCTAGCPPGHVEDAKDSIVLNGEKEQACDSGAQSFCCKHFQPSLELDSLDVFSVLLDEDAAVAAAVAVAEHLAAKEFCKEVISAGVAPLKYIPRIGWFVSLLAKAFKPLLIKECVKGIDKQDKKNAKKLSSAAIHSTCRAKDWPQACYNYASVIGRSPAFRTLLCPKTSQDEPPRLWRDEFNDQHYKEWYDGWMQVYKIECQGDEYPPIAFAQGEGMMQYI